MNKHTEDWISRLEAESIALKSAFMRSAMSLPVITVSAPYSPSRNAVTTNYTGGSTTFNDVERFMVTLSTDLGVSTLATIEINTDSYLPRVRRIPYSGGARWIVTAQPKPSSGTWDPTNYHITVQSALAGSLVFSELTS